MRRYGTSSTMRKLLSRHTTQNRKPLIWKLMPKIAVSVAVVLAFATVGRTAYAHGFGERYDLPVPLDLFVVG